MDWKKKFNTIEVGDLVSCKGWNNELVYVVVYKIINGTIRGCYASTEDQALCHTPHDAGNRYRVKDHTIIRKGVRK